MLFKAKTITNYLAGIFDYEVNTITLYINLARLSGIALGAKTGIIETFDIQHFKTEILELFPFCKTEEFSGLKIRLMASYGKYYACRALYVVSYCICREEV